MFTGIVQALGNVLDISHQTKGKKLLIQVPFAGIELGESIAVNGVCLTVSEIRNGSDLEFFVSHETLDKTNLDSLNIESNVNLERALRLSDRISGHFVQGHVDGLVTLTKIQKLEDCYDIELEIDDRFMKYIVPKCSVSLDGISLTANRVHQNKVSVTIVPHTWANTNLSEAAVGKRLNLEVDILAKHLEKLTLNA